MDNTTNNTLEKEAVGFFKTLTNMFLRFVWFVSRVAVRIGMTATAVGVSVISFVVFALILIIATYKFNIEIEAMNILGIVILLALCGILFKLKKPVRASLMLVLCFFAISATYFEGANDAGKSWFPGISNFFSENLDNTGGKIVQLGNKKLKMDEEDKGSFLEENMDSMEMKDFESNYRDVKKAKFDFYAAINTVDTQYSLSKITQVERSFVPSQNTVIKKEEESIPPSSVGQHQTVHFKPGKKRTTQLYVVEGMRYLVRPTVHCGVTVNKTKVNGNEDTTFRVVPSGYGYINLTGIDLEGDAYIEILPPASEVDLK